MSDPTFFTGASVALRLAEVPDATWTDGMNAAASNAPGIGINITTPPTPVVGSKEQFTLLDQDEDPRTPQVSQYIGGVGYTDPAGWPSSGGVEGKGTEFVHVGTNGPGDGTVISLGDANLPDLNGWLAVI